MILKYFLILLVPFLIAAGPSPVKEQVPHSVSPSSEDPLLEGQKIVLPRIESRELRTYKEEDSKENSLVTLDEMEDPFEDELPKVKELEDPFEDYNRFMFRVNHSLAEHFFKPVTHGYMKVVPETARVSIKRMFKNASAPVRYVGSLAQKDFKKSARVFDRFLINTTLGLGGMFDVASKVSRLKEPVDEDFGQVLGSYGVPAGPYLVLPVMGPSTVRDSLGKAVDSFLTPTNYVAPFAAQTGLALGESVNDFSFRMNDLEELEKSTIDPYQSVQDFYNQYREKQIRE